MAEVKVSGVRVAAGIFSSERFYYCRRRVVSERGVSEVESYMIDDHEMLKRAATECICNLLLSEEVCTSGCGLLSTYYAA